MQSINTMNSIVYNTCCLTKYKRIKRGFLFLVMNCVVNTSLCRSNEVGKDVNALINQESPGIANTEDEKHFQPTEVKPFAGDNVRHLKPS